MKVTVATADFDQGTCGGLKSDKIIVHGYVELDEFDPEKAFRLCNWENWTSEKPEENHTDISNIGHGLIVIDESNKWNPVYHLALSGGWLTGDYQKMQRYFHYHMHPCCLWLREVVF